MLTPRTATRTAAVLGATAALTLAGAGAASATTHESAVDGNTVSVTFELDGDALVDGDACSALLTPTAAAAGIAAEFAGADGVEDLEPVLNRLLNEENVTILKEDGILGSPVVALGTVFDDLGKSSGTAIAEDVPSNVYALVSYCASDESPNINPALIVGDPMDAIMGSVEMGSAGGGLDTASSLLEGGLGGEEGAGLDTLSSVLGGGEGAGEIGLGTLSSALDDGEGEGEQTPES